jgi:putative transposase
MSLDPGLHRRRSIRIPGHDYAAPAAYYITICTKNRECLFGTVAAGTMRLNSIGEIARLCWEEIPIHFPNVETDTFVIMPNHVHGILWVNGRQTDVSVGANNYLPLQPTRSRLFPMGHGTSKTVGSIIRGFKIGVMTGVRKKFPARPIWQRNYYERVIRNDPELNRIRQYIADNPAQWESDRNNPGRIPV